MGRRKQHGLAEERRLRPQAKPMPANGRRVVRKPAGDEGSPWQEKVIRDWEDAAADMECEGDWDT